MIIDSKLLEFLESQAKNTYQLKKDFDLRTSPSDTSQRMLNALMPGTVVPIHRHRGTTETVVILRGCITEVFYDDNGVECGRFELSQESGNVALQIPQGMWHTVVVTEPCVIFEAKDGAFTPLASEDIMNI